MKKILKRSEAPVEQTWDLSALYKDMEAFDDAMERFEKDAAEFAEKYRGNLKTAEDVNEALDALRPIYEAADHLINFVSLDYEVDLTNKEKGAREADTMNRYAQVAEDLAFFDIEVVSLPAEILKEAQNASDENAHYIHELLKKKEHLLSREAEAAMAALSPVLQSPVDLYNQIKQGDIRFPEFTVGGRSYSMTYPQFENRYETETDTELRRKAAEVFYRELDHHKVGTAAVYNMQVQREKIESRLRGYESVFDYLLDSQDVTREMYDRQIDIIMEKLAPVMQRYAKLLKKEHGIAELTSYDLKIELDPTYAAEVSFEDAGKYILDGLAVLGEEYSEMLKSALTERWIDYAENQGKSTGAFCASPYRVQSYILTSFNGKMDEVATLAHELGHAGHFLYAGKHQNIYNVEPSLYFIESPSTTNELIMENYLLKKAGEDRRRRRWVLSQMISKTYYHNFVTHLLEAAYQREVYRIVDAGGSLDDEKLTGIYRKILQQFWGDAVRIEDGSALTWMRQPHYYGGLYSYTYSAGLTIGTVVSQRILKEGKPAVDAWLKVLSAGGTKTPTELAAMVGVDISTSKPLEDTIAYIGSIVEEMEALSEN